jgi:hypothetical protein
VWIQTENIEIAKTTCLRDMCTDTADGASHIKEGDEFWGLWDGMHLTAAHRLYVNKQFVEYQVANWQDEHRLKNDDNSTKLDAMVVLLKKRVREKIEKKTESWRPYIEKIHAFVKQHETTQTAVDENSDPPTPTPTTDDVSELAKLTLFSDETPPTPNTVRRGVCRSLLVCGGRLLFL